jgi:HD-like signal output (HDOD) protein
VTLDLRARLDAIDDLPTLPEVVRGLNTALADPDVSFSRIADIVSDDPVVTAKLLKLVNSAYYRRLADDREITSVSYAVGRVGLMEIRNLALTLSVFGMFRAPWQTIDRHEFWRHSLSAAISTRVLYDFTQALPSHPEDAANVYYVAGLLHDLGIVIQEHYFRREFAEVLTAAREEGMPLHEMEERAWGINHGEVGAYLAFRWNLPTAVVAALNYHHRPAQATGVFATTAHVVHLADYLCLQNGIGPAELLGTLPQVTESLGSLALETRTLYELFDVVTEEARRQDVLLTVAA